MDDNFNRQLARAPITKTILFWRNFDRAPPLYWIFVFAFVVFIVSGALFGRNGFLWISFSVLALYISPAILFVLSKLK